MTDLLTVEEAAEALEVPLHVFERIVVGEGRIATVEIDGDTRIEAAAVDDYRRARDEARAALAEARARKADDDANFGRRLAAELGLDDDTASRLGILHLSR